MNHDFISAGLFSKTEEESEFHSAKSFESIICSISETIFLATAKGKDNSKKYIIASYCNGVSITF